jgi:hypothetical protein
MRLEISYPRRFIIPRSQASARWLQQLAPAILLLFILLGQPSAWAQTCSSAAAVPNSTSAASGTVRIYAFDVSGTNSMLFPTWGVANGQDDLIWYAGVNAGNGTWYADVNLANHPALGDHVTHIYANGTNLCAEAWWTRAATPVAASCSHSSPESSSTSQTSGHFRVYAYNVTGASSVLFPTWAVANGQNDLVWYQGIPKGGGTWYADVNMGNHTAGNPEYGTFTTHVYVNGETGSALCAYHTFSRTSGVSSYPTITASSGMSVTLNPNRGGQVGSIIVPGLGETIVDDFDGRGMGTSGVLLNDAPDHYLFNESGCWPASAGNPYSLIQNFGAYIVGTATRMVNWDSSTAPCPDFPGWNHLANLQIEHKVSFPPAAAKVVTVEQVFRNQNQTTVTFRTLSAGGAFSWPFAPQISLRRSVLIDPTINAARWRIRMADGSWQAADVYSGGGWLDVPSPTRNFYSVPGHAMAVYRDAALAMGAALYCPDLDNGWYAKDLTDDGILGIANVWNITSPLAPGASISKTCQVIYGSESEITAHLGGGGPSPLTPITGVTASASMVAFGMDASRAVDGSPYSAWLAEFAPQWIELDLGANYSVRKVKLKVSQSPAGNTVHHVYLGPAPNPSSLVTTISQYTQESMWLDVDLPSPQGRYLRIVTTSSPSWVSWYEIEVYR